MKKIAVIAGAGPAGLTAALELLRRTDVLPIVLEADAQVGGISKTINYRGNRMDLGGHRFFSKSDWVMNWWQQILPVQGEGGSVSLAYQGQQREFTPAPTPSPANATAIATAAAAGGVMLVRSRLSRIYYRRRFFDYPLKLSRQTFGNLGLAYTAQVGLSYLKSRLMPRRPEATLEDFLYNRFGDKLYRTFFKDYTEKVWGVPCEQISAEWGAQRIKGLSITRAVIHALRRPFQRADTAQKHTETSLIERFLYPEYGPGQMWEAVAEQVRQRGGELHLRHRVVDIQRAGDRIVSITAQDLQDGTRREIPCDYFISTMPLQELTRQLRPESAAVERIAAALPYRDFITAGLLVRRMRSAQLPRDNWIYIQEPDVKLGRLQIFNNWSPRMVADPDTVWLGLEYFCAEGDALWSMPDAQFLAFAAKELAKIGLIDADAVLDGTVVRVAKAYPAYFGSYEHIDQLRRWLDGISNLFPVGRNGMHRYNNQDHSMLSANAAVDCIVAGSTDKGPLWEVNVDDEYHETTKADGAK
ncbi:MAG TPA: NAD(P)/FAD-dependent oxidoreductase [Steroidobacteraceae bacterium]|nr:NAD(P)/FAD-dependent oxidoreductase [Steroidobacteraceae bacterium]